MKRTALFALMLLASCGRDSITAPTTAPSAPATQFVAVLSQRTGQTTLVSLDATHHDGGPGFWTDISNINDPQPPSCAWRDQVIAKHLALGGSKDDIVTLANLHRVFIQDTGDGYVLIDYPAPWCQ